MGAETHLQRYEGHQRLTDNKIRRQARNELAREGKIATEGNIREWMGRREEKERMMEARERAGDIRKEERKE